MKGHPRTAVLLKTSWKRVSKSGILCAFSMVLECFLWAPVKLVFGGWAGAELVLFVENRVLNTPGCSQQHFPPHPAAAFQQIIPTYHTNKFHDCFVFVFFTLALGFTLCFVFNVVAPPRDVQITDSGLLGPLDVEWKPPPHVQTFNECTVKYKFEYRNTGDRDWKVGQSMN